MMRNNIKNRTLAFILSLIMIITTMPIATFALETESVSSCIKSFSIDKSSLIKGDTVTITVETDGEYYPWFVSYYKPITNNTKQFSFSNLSENTYTATMAIDNQTEAGIWEVKSIAFRNSEWDAVHIHNSANFDLSNFEKMDFSALDFEVTGTNADVTPPVLKNYGISKNTVAIGETVELSLVIEEDHPLDELIIYYCMPSGNNKQLRLKIKGQQGKNVTYTSTINITDEFEFGTWKPSHIFLEDSNDNGPIVYNTNTHSSGSSRIDLSKLNFKVICAVHKDVNDDKFCDSCKEYLSKCIETGICGENSVYKFYQDGLLIISGSGETTNYESGSSPFYDTDYTIKTIVIEDGITSIGDYLFEGCSAQSIIIGKDVKCIGNRAFSSSFITSLSIPNDVTTIEEYAFECCQNLSNIVLPNNISHISEGLFIGCFNLTSINIPNNVTTIKSDAFAGCDSLENITIPISVSVIEKNAFYYCRSLTDVKILNSNCSIYDSSNTISDTATIYSKKSSTAQSYAEKYERSFVIYCLHENKEQINATNPSCTEIGFTAGEYCPDCEIWLSGHEVIPATNHKNTTAYPQQNATCTEIGYESGVYCLDCKLWLSGHDAIPATNHKNKVAYPQQNATCTESGYTAGEYCTDCKIWISGHDLIEATGHSYTSVITKKATCTTKGLQHKDCTCGDKVTEEIPALGHNYSTRWTIDIVSTCTKEGSKSHHCTRCESKTDVTIIPVTEHLYGNWIIDKEPTTAETGTKHKECSCGERITEEIPKLDATNLAYNRNKLFEQISAESNDVTNSVSFGSLSTNGYNYYFEVTENKFFVQYKTKNSSWLKVVDFEYDYSSGIVTSDFIQSGSSNYYAATATFYASDYVNTDSIVYKDSTGSNFGGMCITYAENFAATAIPKINQKMLSEFEVSLYKIGFTSYSHTHTGGEATCCSYAICDVCGKVYGSLESHITEIKNQIYATCYEPGYTGDLVCTVCNKVIEYGQSVPIIEREAATGKFDLLKQYILKHGKNDAADNKYIYYSDIIYDANNKPINTYARITYLDEFAKFRLLYTSGEGEEKTSITMDLKENGSQIMNKSVKNGQ